MAMGEDVGMGAEVREAGARARDEAVRLKEEALQRARSVVDRQKVGVAEQMAGFAGALRRSADEFAGQELDSIAHYARRTAAGLDDFADTLRQKDLGGLIGEVEDFARRNPELFLGGSVVAGFLMARFLKSSGGAGAPAEQAAESRFPPDGGDQPALSDSSIPPKGGL